MKKHVKIAHTSDVHLDGRSSNGAGGGFNNVAERAFSEVVSTVQEKQCDLFLIVGDLFDHNRIKASDIEFVRDQLDRIKCPVLLIPGNHDVYDNFSLWHKFKPEELGDNVIAIMEHEGSTIELSELGVTIWGKAMEIHDHENKPLQGIPELSGGNWKIGLAHGQVAERRVTGSSSLITSEEISNSGFDYLALGHVHVWATYQMGEVKACYPGSPVAAYASSQGGHLAIVDLDPESGVNIAKHKLSKPEPQEHKHTSQFYLVP